MDLRLATLNTSFLLSRGSELVAHWLCPRPLHHSLCAGLGLRIQCRYAVVFGECARYLLFFSRSRLQIALRRPSISRSRTPDSRYVVCRAERAEPNDKSSNETLNLSHRTTDRQDYFC